MEKGRQMREGEIREGSRTGPWRRATFKEREGNHEKPMKKTKKDQSKIKRDMRRGCGPPKSRRVLPRPVCLS